MSLEEALAATVAAIVEERIAPLRDEIARLRAGAASGPISTHEAAARLGITVRDVQRRLRDGRLTPEFVGGVRMVRWPQPSGLR